MKKILVVDDETMLREVYSLVLKRQGYEVATADDGISAEAELTASTPDLILLDVMMPNADGVDFLTNVDLMHRYPDVKVILFSNLTSNEKIDQGLALGATMHIPKSTMSPNQLVEQIEALIGS